MKRWAWAVLFVAALCMGACGGSSSSSSGPSFGGNSSKAAVTPDSEQDVLEVVGEGVDLLVQAGYGEGGFDIELTPFLSMFFGEGNPKLKDMSSSETTYDGSCGGTVTMGYTETRDEDTGAYDYQQYLIANNYCNEKFDGPPTFGGTVNGRIDEHEMLLPEFGEAAYRAKNMFTAKNWTEFYPVPDMPDALALPAVDQKFTVDGKLGVTCTGCHFDDEMQSAFVEHPEGKQIAEVKFFVKRTLGDETEGVKYNLTGLYSQVDMVPADGVVAQGPSSEGWDISGSACDYTGGCVNLDTEYLVDYCWEKDYVYACEGTVIIDGAGSDDARLSFGSTEPQYYFQLWDSELGEWAKGTEYTSDYEVYVEP